MNFEKKNIFNYLSWFIICSAIAICSLSISVPLALVVAINGANVYASIYVGVALFVIMYGGGIKLMEYLDKSFKFLEIICRGIYYRIKNRMEE